MDKQKKCNLAQIRLDGVSLLFFPSINSLPLCVHLTFITYQLLSLKITLQLCLIDCTVCVCVCLCLTWESKAVSPQTTTVLHTLTVTHHCASTEMTKNQLVEQLLHHLTYLHFLLHNYYTSTQVAACRTRLFALYLYVCD